MINVISQPCKVLDELNKLDCVKVSTSPIKADIYYWLHMGTFYEYAKRNNVEKNHLVLINPCPAFNEIVPLVKNAVIQSEVNSELFENAFIIEQGSDYKPMKKIGIAATRREYKGEKILRELFEKYEFPNHRFIVAGSRWDILHNYPVELRGHVKDMQSFYNEIDYLLIPTDEEHGEGGPIVFIEAISCCVPVISTNVGYAKTKPCITFSTVNELYEILNNMIKPASTYNTWDMFRKKHIEVFNKIKEIYA